MPLILSHPSAPSIRACPVPLLHVGDVPHPERAVARGELIRVRPGVYAPAELWSGLPPWDRYLGRVYAVLLLNPAAILSHESACAVAGGPIFGDPRTVHILTPPDGASGVVSGVRTHTTTDDRLIHDVAGISLSAPPEFAVDLARGRHPAIGLAVADAVVRMNPAVRADTLAAVNESRASSRGRHIARWSLARARPEAETALESVSRAVIEWLGFPPPELQVPFRDDGVVDRPDFLWPEASLAGEADGDIKYDGRFGDPVEILRQRGLRDQRLRRRLRAVVHWGWAEATAVAPLRSILHGAGLAATAPENAAALFSLRRAVSPASDPHSADRRDPY